MAELTGSLIDRLDRPAAPDRDGGLDVLGDLLDALRVETLVHRRFDLAAPWGIQLPGDDLVYLIAIGRREARLEVAGTRAPRKLSSGDLAILTRGGPHRLRD